ncbi:MAG: prolyl oligopeptidase family serine peptidase [Opitutaceae bacterium]|nr:prolyl oligopeptidase family serine peptidase [Opitutaceae bacterium]
MKPPFAVILTCTFVGILGIATAAGETTRPVDLRSLFGRTNVPGPKRLITVEDVATLRQIPTLRVSPDLRRYALMVREPDPVSNAYVSAWFVGEVGGGSPVFSGDAGETALAVLPSGVAPGDLAAPEASWSPDGEWLAFPVRRSDEIQLWRARGDGTSVEQVTRNPADPLEFEWSVDGRKLYFKVASPREIRRERNLRRERTGYNYDEDLSTYFELMASQLREPPEPARTLWVFSWPDRTERLATESEQAEYVGLKSQRSSGSASAARFAAKSAVMRNASGDSAWLEGQGDYVLQYRVMFSRRPDRTEALACPGEYGFGLIDRLWWSEDGERVRFVRLDLANAPGYRVVEWNVRSGLVTVLFHFPDEFLRECSPVGGDRLIGIRESMSSPVHLALMDLRAREVRVLADVNPEFQHIRIGRVERIEWDTPRFDWNEAGGPLDGAYPKRAVGYVLLPPDFDPSRRYPVFIEPYALMGFNSSVGQEHPLQAYAAAGIVVLNSSFPVPLSTVQKLGANAMGLVYSAELGFPHISMRMESTVNGLKAVESRGYVDSARVGIGGVSNGTFVPLRMMQKHDLIAAASISGGGWGPSEYYYPTKRGRAAMPGKDWRPKPEGAGADYWRELDLAEHVETLEAPILMHHPLSETATAVRLMRHMLDANRPYDAYVFTEETHMKWQPAHRLAIMERNFDWFRFWLQDIEDPVPEKAAQYVRWRKLREMHLANRRKAAAKD